MPKKQRKDFMRIALRKLMAYQDEEVRRHAIGIFKRLVNLKMVKVDKKPIRKTDNST